MKGNLNPDSRGFWIDRHTIAAALLHEKPAAVQWFLAHHLACVGCSLAAFDSLADVARSYGLDEQKMLQDLRVFLNQTADLSSD